MEPARQPADPSATEHPMPQVLRQAIAGETLRIGSREAEAVDPVLAGRMEFNPGAPTRPRLPPGRHGLGLFEERDAVLFVPQGLPAEGPAPLVVLFHGGGGSAQKILPILEGHAEANGFLLLAPQSLFPTWDIVIAGHGPDRERVERALAEVASRFAVDGTRIAFAGHSDGGSYALSSGLTNGHFVTHVMAFSAGFMSVLKQSGAPRVFIGHGINDAQIPVERSARVHQRRLKAAGYDVIYVEHNGPHASQPPIVDIGVRFFLQGRARRTGTPA